MNYTRGHELREHILTALKGALCCAVKAGQRYIMTYTGFIKSNRPHYVSFSHKHGIRLLNLKFLRGIAHVIYVFQIRIMQHIATITM